MTATPENPAPIVTEGQPVPAVSLARDGGGTVSLQLDNQGKTASQGLLTMEIEVAASLLDKDGAAA